MKSETHNYSSLGLVRFSPWGRRGRKTAETGGTPRSSSSWALCFSLPLPCHWAPTTTWQLFTPAPTSRMRKQVHGQRWCQDAYRPGHGLLSRRHGKSAAGSGLQGPWALGHNRSSLSALCWSLWGGDMWRHAQTWVLTSSWCCAGALYSLTKKILPISLWDRNYPPYTKKLRLRGLSWLIQGDRPHERMAKGQLYPHLTNSRSPLKTKQSVEGVSSGGLRTEAGKLSQGRGYGPLGVGGAFAVLPSPEPKHLWLEQMSLPENFPATYLFSTSGGGVVLPSLIVQNPNS